MWSELLDLGIWGFLIVSGLDRFCHLVAPFPSIAWPSTSPFNPLSFKDAKMSNIAY